MGLSTLFGHRGVSAGPGTVKVRLDLGSWEFRPFMWAHLARDVEVSWEPGNIDAVRIYLESGEASAEKVLLGSTSGVVYPKLAGDANEYMGDWGLDHAFPYFDDAGVDTQANGTSVVPPVDPEYRLAFKLLPGITGRFLLLEIDVTDLGAQVTIHYPRLLLGNSAVDLIAMSRNNQLILQENGPGITHAGSSFYVGGLQIPPIPQGRLVTSSILDMLCYRRALFEGVHPETGGTSNLPTELTQLFDTTEGQGYGQVESSDSLGFMLPADVTPGYRFAIVNCRAEMPPISCLPRGDRTAATWAEIKTTWVGKAWVWARDKRFIVSADQELHLFEPKGTQWTVSGTPPFDPWKLTEHTHAVDNNEGLDHEIRLADGTEIANVRPWHNFFGIYDQGGAAAADGAITHSEDLGHKHCFAWVNVGGTVSTSRSPNTLPYVLDTGVDTGIDADWVHIAYEVRGAGRLWMIVEFGGDALLYESTDHGRSFTLATTVFTGPGYSHCVAVSGRKDNILFCYAVVSASNKIVGRIFDSALNELEAEFDAVASGVADKGFDAWERTINEGERKVCIGYINSAGSKIFVEGPDGRTFS